MSRYDHRRLRAARETAGLTQQAVADAIYKTPSTYARYEQGAIFPTVPVLGAIAEVLGVEIGDLFDAEDPTDPVSKQRDELAAFVASAPPLTTEQRTELRALLREPQGE